MTSDPKPARYRPDVDGLRAIAVVSILLYHVGIGGFGGGFVGVDVFFVISGFLITRLIADEVDATGAFRFGRFYARRVRRLFPAVLMTSVLTLVAAICLFSPEDLRRCASSAIYAIFSAANFLFWWQTDYFDVSAHTKPLLHTWSLSVEEQFYLLWPATLVLLLTRVWRRARIAVSCVLAGASLLIAERWLESQRAAAFYLLPARIVELLIGGAVVWLLRHRPASRRVQEPLLVAGLALIAYPVIAFTSRTRFPGASALVPCLGTALAIYAGTAPSAGVVLRNPLAIAIGKSSYSIYLLHWPLVVFYESFRFAPLVAVERWMLAAASIGLGWIQYRFVEETFRHELPGQSVSRGRFVLSAAALAALVGALALGIWLTGGMPWRVPVDRLVPSNAALLAGEARDYCRRFDDSKPRDLFTCQNHRGQERDIIVWGDSHASHLIAGFSDVYPMYNVHVAYLVGCEPQIGFAGYTRDMGSVATLQRCIERNRDVLAFLSTHHRSHVVLAAAKRGTPETIAGPTNTILEALEQAGHQAFVLGDFIRPGRALANCMSVPALLVSNEHIRARCVPVESGVTSERAYNDAMEALVPRFVNVNGTQCPDGSCRFFDDGGRPLHRDDHHLSPYGAAFFIGRLQGRLPM